MGKFVTSSGCFSKFKNTLCSLPFSPLKLWSLSLKPTLWTWPVGNHFPRLWPLLPATPSIPFSSDPPCLSSLKWNLSSTQRWNSFGAILILLAWETRLNLNWWNSRHFVFSFFLHFPPSANVLQKEIDVSVYRQELLCSYLSEPCGHQMLF